MNKRKKNENESEKKKESDKNKITENLRAKEREAEINEKYKRREKLNDGRKIERKTNFYAKASGVKRALFLKKAYDCTFVQRGTF